LFKMKSVVVASLIASTAAFVPASKNAVTTTALSETKEDLETLAKGLNPIVGYWDPLGLVDAGFWGYSREQTIGWLRQAEIKHSRVAMAAFVGYCVQSNILLPYKAVGGADDIDFSSMSPPEQWDAIPFVAKAQIIVFVGFLEFYSEAYGTHYTKGGKPGAFPAFDKVPHKALSLYDPFGFTVNKSDEWKANGLKVEINNGRLAMLGIFGFLSAQTIPGSVPLLNNVVTPYSGEVMAPFQGN